MSDFESWAGEEIDLLRHGTQLKIPSPYQSLYRYVGLNTKTSWDLLERMLQKSELVGATAHSLNDPFELSPFRFDDLSAATVPRAPSLRERLEGTKAYTDREERDRINDIRERSNAFLDAKIKNARIIAFCQQSQSGLLWSHYANSYRGACLHFMARGFTRLSGDVGLVNYSRYRPTYPLSLAAHLARPSIGNLPPAEVDSLKRSESNKMLFFTKSEDWSYECEARIVFDIRRTNSITFQPHALASVILGPRMTSEDANRIKEILARSAYANLPIRQARLSSTTFSVEMDEPPLFRAARAAN